MALQEQYAAKGLQFIGIAIDDQEPVEEYLATTKINYPILIGGVTGIALAHQLGNVVDAVPFTLVVNQQGQIIHRQPGEFPREKIMEIITPLLN
jgi:peroxiredoxin